jgi:penicillin-binding protein 1B
VGTPARPYPSIALGVFEASPLEIATAYTVFTNNGMVRPLQAVSRIIAGSKPLKLAEVPARPVARPEATYLVTNLLRSVLNEGTAAAVRSSFSLDAAGKTGTTNDLRDAWFAGFTPELLTVVWVGLDDNQPIGLSGSQAALPIWMARLRRPHRVRRAPGRLIPSSTGPGKLATPNCPPFNEAFLAGAEPHEVRGCQH